MTINSENIAVLSPLDISDDCDTVDHRIIFRGLRSLFGINDSELFRFQSHLIDSARNT